MRVWGLKNSFVQASGRRPARKNRAVHAPDGSRSNHILQILDEVVVDIAA